MTKNEINKIWKKYRETISYLFFGVLTTLVDWVSYQLMRQVGIDYKASTIGSWAAAVAFAYVTNKLFVFCSKDTDPKTLLRETVSFVGCRAATGLFTLAAMMFFVEVLKIQNDFIGKVIVSAISLVLNYILSKLFIFRTKTVKEQAK